MKSTLFLAAALALTLTLSACGTKYESWGWSDNNCSGNGGIYTESYCSGYTDGP